MKNRRSTRRLLLLFVGSVLFSSCAWHERMAADLPKTFLEDADISKTEERLPFDHAWLKPGVDWASYTGVYVKPIRTDRLPRDQWSNSRSAIITSQEDYLGEADALARYFHERLIAELKDRKGVHLSAVKGQPGPGVVVVELAFSELQFSHPLAKAGSLVAPVPGAGIAFAGVTDPYVIFAARVSDGGTGKLIATAADRKFAPTRLIDVNKLTVTSANREICNLWAEEIADTFASDALTKIEEERWSLLPW